MENKCEDVLKQLQTYFEQQLERGLKQEELSFIQWMAEQSVNEPRNL